MTQLHKLHKHASELEWSGGRRGGAEAEGVRGGQRWVEKGKGGHTMTWHATSGLPEEGRAQHGHSSSAHSTPGDQCCDARVVARWLSGGSTKWVSG